MWWTVAQNVSTCFLVALLLETSRDSQKWLSGPNAFSSVHDLIYPNILVSKLSTHFLNIFSILTCFNTSSTGWHLFWGKSLMLHPFKSAFQRHLGQEINVEKFLHSAFFELTLSWLTSAYISPELQRQPLVQNYVVGTSLHLRASKCTVTLGWNAHFKTWHTSFGWNRPSYYPFPAFIKY